MVEHERSYVFSYQSFEKIFGQTKLGNDKSRTIVADSYLDRNTRVRKITLIENVPVEAMAPHRYWITKKEGKKSDGYRVEQEVEISEDVYLILKGQAKLHVEKERSTFEALQSGYNVIVDKITAPMKLVIVEIEAKTEAAVPVPLHVTENIFGFRLKECPLSAYELFKRKVGICGGPSAGKSETAKAITHRLNTEYRANSFYVTEFATTFIQKYGRNPTFNDQPFIWYGQRQREMDAESSNIVLSDCPTFLSYIYMLMLNDKEISPESALYLSKIYKRVLFDVQTYSDIILMKIKEYKENGVRYHDFKSARDIEKRIRTFLKDHQIPYAERTYNDVDKIIDEMFYINNDKLPNYD